MSETTQAETTLAVVPFNLPGAYENPEFSSEELSDDMEGLQATFQRVKIPSGGALQYEIPSDNPERPGYVEYLQGVIIHHHAANAYWPDGGDEDDNTPPVCSSNNGCVGVGDPGGACETCGMNQYGSGEEGRAKACKNMRHVYLLRSGEFLPILLSLSPTSLRPFAEFVNAMFVARRRASWGSLVEIGLKRQDNGKHLYSVATFKKLADFAGPQLAEVKAYAETFKQRIKDHLKARTAETEAGAEAYESYMVGADGINAVPGVMPAGGPEDFTAPLQATSQYIVPMAAPQYVPQALQSEPQSAPQYAAPAAQQFVSTGGPQLAEDLPFDVAGAGAVINGDTQQLPA